MFSGDVYHESVSYEGQSDSEACELRISAS